MRIRPITGELAVHVWILLKQILLSAVPEFQQETLQGLICAVVISCRRRLRKSRIASQEQNKNHAQPTPPSNTFHSHDDYKVAQPFLPDASKCVALKKKPSKNACHRQTCLYVDCMSAARQRILETASALFFERGYEHVGVNELIEKSGVAKATFYQHFPSKEKLCIEWLNAAARDSDASARELLEEKLPPVEKVAKKFDILRECLSESKFRGCPFSNTASSMVQDNDVRTVVREYKDNARFFWQALALQLRSDPSAARALGDTLFLLYSGAASEAQNFKATWPVDSAKAAALALCDGKG